MATRFHSRVGSMVVLSNGGKTAQRNQPAQEFNNGVAFSAEPLKDNQSFEVKIDRKVNSWSGSIEVGVTSCDPANLIFPTSATGFREGTWVMSGCSIMRDGHTILDEYGHDLDQLAEGDRVGVMRSATGVLHISINGVDQGPAASGIPQRVWAVIDMYGKCAQVTVVEGTAHETDAVSSSTSSAGEHLALCRLSALCNNLVAEALTTVTSELTSNGQLVFHDRCGTLVQLSNGRRTAERLRPLDEFNNGVVMTARPLRDNERFEIRIDHLVDKWSGSIEVGITTHNPNNLDFPATMTNMRSGTIMMSGSGILTNGKGTRREYGDFNLDELQKGDRIGLVRKSSGALHYFINDVDQGVATARAPQIIWGVVDLYGMAVKVTIVDVADNTVNVQPDRNSPARRVSIRPTHHHPLQSTLDECREHNERIMAGDRLQFHPRCGSHAAVINGQRTAHRPHAVDDFNNAVILTNRQLRTDELFEVQLDQLVDKWAGSIEIGVTTHSPQELEFPSTMTNVRTGTWMMTGNGVMHNGTTVLEDYGQNLDRLRVGDRVGVRRKADGSLHFYVNGVDQGLANTNVPPNIYGVIDLYGQAGQATIVYPQGSDLPETPSSAETSILTPVAVADVDTSNELLFHRRHGRNASVSADGQVASRSSARGEFNEAIVLSSRPLHDEELFEISVIRMVERWSGSLEVGVTLIKPEVLEFPNTLTDIDHDTWMLSGSSVMRDGTSINSSYQLDLDKLRTGSRVGLMRCSDGTLHYYLNGVDQGVAVSSVPSGVYAILDLYGQCAEVVINHSQSANTALNLNIRSGSTMLPLDIDQSSTSPTTPGVTHRFATCHGQNIVLKNGGCTATRVNGYDHSLIFSSELLRPDELFEVRIESLSTQWSGSLLIGLTMANVAESFSAGILPPSAINLQAKSTWLVRRSEVVQNGVIILTYYCPSLERLAKGDRIGVMRCMDGTMHVLVNDVDFGIAATNIPQDVSAVIDLYGQVEAVCTTSTVYANAVQCSDSNFIDVTRDSVNTEVVDSLPDVVHLEEDGGDEFSDVMRGENVIVSSDRKTIKRSTSYNGGVVVSKIPLRPGRLFQVQINRVTADWSSSIAVGVTSLPSEEQTATLPKTALDIRWPSWIVFADAVYHNTTKLQMHQGQNLETLEVGQTVGVMVDHNSSLHLFIDGNDVGVVARGVSPDRCHAVVDVYGQCEEVTVVSANSHVARVSGRQEHQEKADKEDGLKEKHHVQRSPLTTIQLSSENCIYQTLCARVIKACLCLPDGYFNAEANCCFCEACHKARAESLYFRHGEPAREYALPVGWCKFALRLQPKFDGQHSTIVEKWHIAYSGTNASEVRKRLDTGDLLAVSGKATSTATASNHTFAGISKCSEILIIGNVSCCRGAIVQLFLVVSEKFGEDQNIVYKISVTGDSLIGGLMSRSLFDRFDEKNKPDEKVVSEPVILSPSIRYAGSLKFAAPFEYKDLKTRKQLHVRIALQVYVKPGSYMVGSIRHDDASGLTEPIEQIDAKISNNELEWSTKERGSTAMCALLVCIE